MAVQGGVRGLLRRFAPPGELEQPSRDAMLASAQWRVASAFDVDYDGLRLIAEERRPGEGVWEFEFRDEVNVYLVEMGAVGGIPLSSRVRRTSTG